MPNPNHGAETPPTPPRRSEFDGHMTPIDHSGCHKTTITLCDDDWIRVAVILNARAESHPATDNGYCARLITGYIRKALGF